MQVQGERITVTARGFQTSVQTGGGMLAQPAVQGFETFGGVGKDGGGTRVRRRSGGTQANVELVFRDVNAEDVGGLHMSYGLLV